MADYLKETYKGPVKSDIRISTNEVQLHSIEPAITSEGSTETSNVKLGTPSVELSALSAEGSSSDKSRISLACHACRNRKVRCDGTRPICNTCSRRHEQCVYDFAPKRRGPDRQPGTRQRAPKGTSAPKKRKRNPEDPAGSEPPIPLIVPVNFTSTAPDGPVPLKRRRPSISNVQRLTNEIPPPAIPISLPGPAPPESDYVRTLDGGKLPLTSLVRPDGQLSRGYEGRSFQTDAPGSSRPQFLDSAGIPAIAHSLQTDPRLAPSASLRQLDSTSPETPASLLLQPTELPSIQVSTGQYSSGWTDDSVEPLETGTSSFSLPSGYDGYSSSSAVYPSSSYSYTPSSSLWTPQPFQGYSNLGPVKTEPKDEHYYVDSIARGPSLKFNQETWWDTILLYYSPNSRDEASRMIIQDLQLIFKTAHTMLSFIHVPYFFNMLYHPERRLKEMQPSLVLSLLAMSTLTQSSEVEGGGEKRLKALKLREFAQAAFDASCNSGSVDTMLAQAAWLFVLFESSPHPLFSDFRLTSAAFVFDNVVRALYLTCIDAANPEAPVFRKHEVPALARTDPMVLASYNGSRNGRTITANPQMAHISPSSAEPLPSEMTSLVPTIRSVREPLRSSRSPQANTSLPLQKEKSCPCLSLSMTSSPEAQRTTPLWLMMPRWDSSLTEAEIRMEESRRLVWSSLTLLGGEASARVVLGKPQLDLYIARPENYALLFPGEYLYQQRPELSAVYSGKESTWALYARTMLLWNVCVRMRESEASPNEKADFAVRTWLETIAIEEALNEHDCDGEKVTLYLAREYIFITRMHISHEYRSHVPFPHTVDFSRLNRAQAMQWLHHQNAVALQMKSLGLTTLTGVAGKMLSKRPYLVWWWMNQAVRALRLFLLDPSLTFAMEVVENIMPIVDFCERLWPCAEQRSRKGALMARITLVKGMNDLHPHPLLTSMPTGTTLHND